jgi:hypothetical protein
MAKHEKPPTPADRTDPLPQPRDADLAVREELDLALRRGTRGALELFLARHGDHALAAEARKALGRSR